MKGLCNDQRGNIRFALLVVILSSVSSLNLLYLAFADTSYTHKDCSQQQVFHFLRSETNRSITVIGNLNVQQEGFYLPEKQVVTKDSRWSDTYLMSSRILLEQRISPALLTEANAYRILSLVQTEIKPIYISPIWLIPTSIRGYAESSLSSSSNLSSYALFIDHEASTNVTPIPYNGADVVYGTVFSNSDIWITQNGGGSNNGWSTFYGKVVTAGVIQSFTGTPPYQSVFRGGYFEHAQQMEIPVSANEIRAHGTPVGPSTYDPNRILSVTVSGSAYHSWIGYVVNVGADTADVWSMYPPRAGNYLFQNHIVYYDTLWSPGPSGPCTGHSQVVFSKLWIKGRFQGAQTWCSVDTLYISDNCYLYNTPLGSCPDGSVPGSIMNNTDILGLVSEKSILVQYGYQDPSDEQRYLPNCDGDAQGAWIYAAMAALGDGNGNSHRDGVFSFEYQHPHPAVPAMTLNGNSYVWYNIDLHRHRYPPRPSMPWPTELDLPHYNPLWPEPSPYLERGTIHLWGSLAQRRQGYVHRDLSDDNYPNPNGVWNVPMDFCGGPAGNSYPDPVLGMTFNCRNAPNTSGSGVGYDKDYHFDNRFNRFSPPDFPGVPSLSLNKSSAPDSWVFKKPPRSLTVLD